MVFRLDRYGGRPCAASRRCHRPAWACPSCDGHVIFLTAADVGKAPEISVTRRPPSRSQPWYAEWFGRDYLDVYVHRDKDEARRQIDLMERAFNPSFGARVLDLCCGAGRHAVELARRSYRVVGVDLSRELLGEAQKEARGAGVSVRFIQCDMRTVVAPGQFDVVVNFFTSFGYFETDEENLDALAAIRANLRAGGSWLIDYLNRDWVIRTLVPRDERQIGDIYLIQERRIDPVRSRIVKTLTLKRGESVRTYTESVRMYSLPELMRLTERAGLRISQMFGSPDGSPYGVSSPRLILAGTTR